MKVYRLVAFVLLSLAVVSPCVDAKRDDAPGILKKPPLVISNLTFAFSPTVTATWSTNRRSDSTLSVTKLPIDFDVVVYLDPALTTDHQMTLPLVVTSGALYEYHVTSTDLFGYTDIQTGTFTAP